MPEKIVVTKGLPELLTQKEIKEINRKAKLAKSKAAKVTPAPEVTIPKPIRPLTEAQKPAMVEFYRIEAQKWRDIANKETMKEPSKEGEIRFATAIQKAEAFEKAATETTLVKDKIKWGSPFDIRETTKILQEKNKQLQKPSVARLAIRPYRGQFLVQGSIGGIGGQSIQFVKKEQAEEFKRRVYAGEDSDIVAQDIWKLTPLYSLNKLEKVQTKRSPQAQRIDAQRKHSVVLESKPFMTGKQVRSWIKDQGTADIQGIDTPKGKLSFQNITLKPRNVKLPSRNIARPKNVRGKAFHSLSKKRGKVYHTSISGSKVLSRRPLKGY